MSKLKTPSIPKYMLTQMILEIQNASADVLFPRDTAHFSSTTEEEVLNIVLPAIIDRLRMSNKYLVFDLEATRRENKFLKQDNADCKQIIQEMFEDTDNGGGTFQ